MSAENRVASQHWKKVVVEPDVAALGPRCFEWTFKVASRLLTSPMDSTLVTKGKVSGETELVIAVVVLVGVACYFFFYLPDRRWFQWIFGLVLLAKGLRCLSQWWLFRRGRWRVEWDDSRVRILEDEEVCYDGNLCGMHAVDKDGRGYFLYPTRDTVFRLRKGRSSAEFEARLDGFRSRLR